MADKVARPDPAGMALASGLEMETMMKSNLVNSAYDAITDMDFGVGLGAYSAVLSPAIGFTRPPGVIDPVNSDPNAAFPAVGAHTPLTHAWPIPYRALQLDMQVESCGCGLCAEKAEALIAVIMHGYAGNDVGTTILARPGGKPIIIPATAWVSPASGPNSMVRLPTVGVIRIPLGGAPLNDRLAPRLIARWRGDYHNAALTAAILF